MRFDLEQLDPQIGYKLLTATVTPRPIAWITTLCANGVVNAAPYSFFNVMGHTPPTVAIGLLRDPARGLKDTAANIEATGEFVVNLVPEVLAQQMNVTSMDAPVGVSELECAGLEAVPSEHVAPPRIAASPVSFECRALHCLMTGAQQMIVIGQVLCIHIKDKHVLDAARGYVDTPALGLIGRMHGSGWYARSSDLFNLPRPSYADWLLDPANRENRKAEALPDSVDSSSTHK